MVGPRRSARSVATSALRPGRAWYSARGAAAFAGRAGHTWRSPGRRFGGPDGSGPDRPANPLLGPGHTLPGRVIADCAGDVRAILNDFLHGMDGSYREEVRLFFENRHAAREKFRVEAADTADHCSFPRGQRPHQRRGEQPRRCVHVAADVRRSGQRVCLRTAGIVSPNPRVRACPLRAMLTSRCKVRTSGIPAMYAEGVMAAREWSDLSKRSRGLIIAAAVAEGSLKTAALIDLKRRPASQIRGSKWRWAPVLGAVTPLGGPPPASFFCGRRRQPRPQPGRQAGQNPWGPR